MKRGTDEVAVMKRIAKTLDSLPLDGRCRALAFLIARTLGVGSCPASDALYREAKRAHDAAEEAKEPKEPKEAKEAKEAKP